MKIARNIMQDPNTLHTHLAMPVSISIQESPNKTGLHLSCYIPDLEEYGFGAFKSKVLKYYPEMENSKIAHIASVNMTLGGFQTRFDNMDFNPSMSWSMATAADEKCNIEAFRNFGRECIFKKDYKRAGKSYSHCLIQLSESEGENVFSTKDLVLIVLCFLVLKNYEFIDEMLDFETDSKLVLFLRELTSCVKNYNLKGFENALVFFQIEFKNSLEFTEEYNNLIGTLKGQLYHEEMP
jgi:hypothetical protein